MTRALITGGAGFIGAHLLEHIFKNTDWEVVCLDRLDCSGNLNRLAEILESNPQFKKRYQFIWHDLKAPINSQIATSLDKPNIILHLAASSHVDRSIEDPLSFVMDNVVGTCNVLTYARQLDGLERIVNFSTDEVFGPAPEGVAYKEWDRYDSTNPYSASKAGQEELGLAFANTYKLPLITTHSMNVFGERQSPEKFIPLVIKRILDREKILIHTDSTGKPGSRHYIHARNVSDAVIFLCEKGINREKYNLVGQREVDNLEVTKMIGELLKTEPIVELTDFHSSRPGHDLRYALADTKLGPLGFKHKVSFEEGLQRTVWWTSTNRRWLS